MRPVVLVLSGVVVLYLIVFVTCTSKNLINKNTECYYEELNHILIHPLTRESIQDIIFSYSSNANLWHLLGLSYYIDSLFDEAFFCASKALELRPNNSVQLAFMAKVLTSSDQVAEAEVFVKRSLEVNGSYTPALLTLAEILEIQGQKEEAESVYRQVLQKNPFSSCAAQKVSTSTQSKGLKVQLPTAAGNQLFCAALPNVGEVNAVGEEEITRASQYAFESYKLAAEGDTKAAVIGLEQAATLVPNDPRLLNDLGFYLAQNWEMREAALCFERALTIDPSYVEAMINLGSALTELRSIASAEMWYLKVLDQAGLDLNQSNSAVLNLARLYRDQGLIEKAINTIVHYTGISTSGKGGYFSTIISLFELRQEDRNTLEHYERVVRASTTLELEGSLYFYILNVQQQNLTLSNELMIYLQHVGIIKEQQVQDIFGEFFGRVPKLEEPVSNARMGFGEIHLIFQYFRTIHSERQKELDFCLQQNLNNPLLSKIHILSEELFNFSSFRNSQKIVQTVISKRLTFKEAFMYTNTYLSGQLCILANADIYFDHSLGHFGDPAKLYMTNQLYALLRWDDYGGLKIRIDSQDSWIFKPPIPKFIIENTDFSMGLARCDNRIAQIFIESGYTVLNPCFAIVSHHLENRHRTGLQTYASQSQVPGQGSFVKISSQYKF